MAFLLLPAGLDACFVGVPFDCGTTYRPGARFGPSQIRTESLMVRAYNKDTGKEPVQRAADNCEIFFPDRENN